MARGKPKKADIGDNSALSEEDAAALQVHYVAKARAAMAEVEEARAEVKSANAGLKNIFDRVRADLNLQRKEVEALIADLDKPVATLRAEHAKRRKLLARHGVMVEQGDLFARPADAADEAGMAYEDGLRCGQLALDPTPPKTTPPIFHNEWMKGWHEGQAQNGAKLKRAEEILSARSAPDFSDDDDDDDDQIDIEEALDPDVIADKARKLKKSGFMEPAPEDPEDVLAPEVVH